MSVQAALRGAEHAGRVARAGRQLGRRLQRHDGRCSVRGHAVEAARQHVEAQELGLAAQRGARVLRDPLRHQHHVHAVVALQAAARVDDGRHGHVQRLPAARLHHRLPALLHNADDGVGHGVGVAALADVQVRLVVLLQGHAWCQGALEGQEGKEVGVLLPHVVCAVHGQEGQLHHAAAGAGLACSGAAAGRCVLAGAAGQHGGGGGGGGCLSVHDVLARNCQRLDGTVQRFV
mmetsp:Transcript_15174/g.37802  ORF Transcript_15174/g.37802 Transcript_15174/m.37802 type:complete len:233 (+) Transcript_15174:1110-1808(+)